MTWLPYSLVTSRDHALKLTLSQCVFKALGCFKKNQPIITEKKSPQETAMYA